MRLRLPRFGLAPQITVAVLILGLLGAMAIEPTRQLLEQRQRISGMAQDLDQIERSNRRLEDRIERLQDPDFLEQRAREIGLVRQGETSIVVMPPSKRDRAPQRTSKDNQPPEPRPLDFVDGFFNFVGFF
ncbi:MAG TPA: septum formation initiator family protein [Actinomycetota bacterium]|nr:septum formation initiator family protein [Actinomycetota bacterium]